MTITIQLEEKQYSSLLDRATRGHVTIEEYMIQLLAQDIQSAEAPKVEKSDFIRAMEGSLQDNKELYERLAK